MMNQKLFAVITLIGIFLFAGHFIGKAKCTLTFDQIPTPEELGAVFHSNRYPTIAYIQDTFVELGRALLTATELITETEPCKTLANLNTNGHLENPPKRDDPEWKDVEQSVQGASIDMIKDFLNNDEYKPAIDKLTYLNQQIVTSNIVRAYRRLEDADSAKSNKKFKKLLPIYEEYLSRLAARYAMAINYKETLERVRKNEIGEAASSSSASRDFNRLSLQASTSQASTSNNARQKRSRGFVGTIMKMLGCFGPTGGYARLRPPSP